MRQIADASGQPIQPSHQDRIRLASSDRRQRARQSGPVQVSRAPGRVNLGPDDRMPASDRVGGTAGLLVGERHAVVGLSVRRDAGVGDQPHDDSRAETMRW